jgi:cytochrome c553
MRTVLLSTALVLMSAARAGAADGLEFFEKKIRPVLVEHCYSCHSAKAEKQKGGLLLDSRDALRKGGDSGPALVPGKPAESLLMLAVRQMSRDVKKMPPKSKLPDAAIADLEAWITMGAPDPRDKPDTATAGGSWEEMLRTRRGWWSLQPVHKPAMPTVKNAGWSEHPVDRFLLAKLEQAGLQPAEPADRRTLIRRVSLVLTGLPPTPEEIEDFVHDASANAYQRLVDRLLASPHFGERWARHWLDVVHFSETHGNEWNYEVHHAWRYRDYLIRAFNDDVPYDQFVREHIAGDLLSRPRWNTKEQFNESIIGTAFYRFGEANHDDCISLRQIGYDLQDNQIDTLSKAFQATTVACARCHDHKIDAVSMKDYYALLGILRSSREVSHTIDGPEVNAAPMQRLRELKVKMRQELGEVWLREARDVGRYLLAAQARQAKSADASKLAEGLDAARIEAWIKALKADKETREDPLSPWRLLAAARSDAFAAAWKQEAEHFAKEDRERSAFNQGFTSFGAFRSGDCAGWQIGGQGLRQGPTRSGDFALNADGDSLVRALLPAGCFTHTLSDRLNGTLRSPVLAKGTKHISVQVMGRHSSALRLVSNNCQLNYKNYRALTWDGPRWHTFTVPEDCDSLRCYVELMTMFDNPKFPDQLSALGGDSEDYKLPWEQAAANPHSYFGVTRAVLHDGPEPPRAEVSHLRPLYTGAEPAALTDLADRYTATIEAAVRAWSGDKATDDDVRWLDTLLQRGLLGNSPRSTPALEALATQYRATEKELALPRVVPGVADCGPGFEQALFERGDCTRPTAPVTRRYLEVLSRSAAPFVPTGSGRRELAERIASTSNPLTARVMVNRLWHHLFGTGIVRSTDDFGRVGDLPSHPELLDYLAAQFVEDGWSTKRLIRSLVLTRAFQLGDKPSTAAQETDPQDRLLSHYPARRMEAEAIRDSILAASGRLERTLYGPSIQPYRDKANADRRLFPGPLDGNGRRSIYIKNNLMEAPKFLGVFNFPGGKVTQGRRDVTNVPAQALALLNDPFVLQQADVWASRLVERSDATVAARLDAMFLRTLGRVPTKDERQRYETAVGQLAVLHEVPAEGVLKNRAVWTDVAHTMFNLKEFIYIP